MLPLLSIRTTGYEKLSFTLVLAITAAGTITRTQLDCEHLFLK
jgi:hypothetical protein